MGVEQDWIQCRRKKNIWILGEALKHELEMEDAVIEGMDKASQLTSKENLNPLWGQSGEILPHGVERNFNGLVRK
jgi:hypothetical protein